MARACRSSGTCATPNVRAVCGCSHALASNRAPPSWSSPSVGASMPDNTSSNSLWPLPDTPATPTISPPRSVRLRPFKRTTFRASRTKILVACNKTSPTVLVSSFMRPVCTLRPTIASARPSQEACAIGNSCTTRPARITVTWSHKRMTSFSLCVISKMVVPRVRNTRSTSNNCSVSCGVNTAVGSSRIRILAPRYKAFKISSRWRSPTGRSATKVSSATCSPVDCISMLSWLRTCASARFNSQWGSAPSITFSSALRESTNMKCWCTMPMPRAMASSALRMSASLPNTSIVPASAW